MELIVPRDLICGVCSGIPPCCIAFYLEQKGLGHSIEEGGPLNPKIFKLFRKLQLRLGKAALSPYILCPACRKRGHVIEINDCTDPNNPPYWVKASVKCFLHDHIPLPNWGDKYGYALQDFIKIYREGAKVEKGFLVVNYNDAK